MSDELIFTCTCEYEVFGIADLVVARARQHGRDEHNMDLTDEQVRAMARPLDAPAGPGNSASSAFNPLNWLRRR